MINRAQEPVEITPLLVLLLLSLALVATQTALMATTRTDYPIQLFWIMALIIMFLYIVVLLKNYHTRQPPHIREAHKSKLRNVAKNIVYLTLFCVVLVVLTYLGLTCILAPVFLMGALQCCRPHSACEYKVLALFHLIISCIIFFISYTVCPDLTEVFLLGYLLFYLASISILLYFDSPPTYFTSYVPEPIYRPVSYGVEVLDPIHRYVVPIVYFMHDLRTATSLDDASRALLRVLLHVVSPSACYEIFTTMRRIYTSEADLAFLKSVIYLLEDSKAEEEESEYMPKADFGKARDYMTKIKIFKHGEFVTKVSKVLYGFMGLAIAKNYSLKLSAYGLREFSHESLKKHRFTSTSDIVVSVLDAFLTLADMSSQCFESGSFKPFLTSNRDLSQFVTNCEKVSTSYRNLPQIMNVEVDDLLSLIAKTKEHGKLLMHDPHLLRLVQLEMRILDDISHKLRIRYSVTSTRQPPFSILLYGTPGTGKTALANRIIDYYHQIMVKKGFYPNLQLSEQNVYTCNPNDEYMSGFRGAEHWAFLMDDVGREPIKQVQNGQGTSVKQVIDFVNSTGMAANMADLPDKGNLPIKPKIVVGTTNLKHLNAIHAVSNGEAILRRFPYVVTVEVKEACKDASSGHLSYQIGENSEGVTEARVYEDPWDLQLERVKLTKVNSSTNVEYIPLELPNKQPWDLASLLHFLGKEMIAHEIKSRAALNDVQFGGKNFLLCEHDIPSSLCKQCFQPKSAATYQETLDTIYWYLEGLTTPERDNMFVVTFWIIFIFVYAMTPFYAVFMPLVDVSSTLAKNTTRALWHRFFYRVRRMIVYQTKMKMYYAMSSAQKKLRKNLATMLKLTVAAGGLCVLLMAFKKMYPDKSFQPQSVNIWEQKERETKTGGISSPLIELENSLSGNLFRLVVDDQFVHALCLGDGSFITVRHVFGTMVDGEPKNCSAQFSAPVSNTKIGESRHFVIYPSQVTDIGKDLVHVSCKSLPPRKDIKKFLSDTFDTIPRRVRIFSIDDDMTRTSEEAHTYDYKNVGYPGVKGSPVQYGKFIVGSKPGAEITNGTCGSLVLAFNDSNQSWFIQGLLVAASKENSFLCTPLRKDIVPESLISEGDYEYFAKGSKASGPLQPLSKNNVFQWCQDGHANILGSFPGRTSMFSKTKKGILHDALRPVLPLTEEYCAPMMRAQVINDEWVNPWVVGINKQFVPSPFIPSPDLAECVAAFKADLCLSTDWLKDVQPESIDVAINGIDGNGYVNRLPMGTSGGFHFPGPKRRLFYEQSGTDRLIPNDELLGKIDFIKGRYMTRQRANIIYQACLKDEAVKKSKFNTGKTRVFAGCGADFSIVVRQQFLRVTEAIMRNNFISECAVGMNPYSKDWSKLKDYLCAHGQTHIFGGDYVSFDKRMDAAMILAAFEILTHLCQITGKFSEEDILMQLGIRYDVAFPVVNNNGDVCMFFGSNPSGHPLTVIINSIVNSLYMRLAFQAVTEHPVSDFRKYVNLMTLGDDNVAGSGDDYFNHTSVSDYLQSIDVGYTMPNKEDASIPYIPLPEIDFLKRKFEMLDDRVVAPLDLQSTFRSLLYITAKGNISEEEQLVQSYLNARREWALHGEQVFNDLVLAVDPIIRECPMMNSLMYPVYYSYDWYRTLQWVRGDLVEENQPLDEWESVGEIQTGLFVPHWVLKRPKQDYSGTDTSTRQPSPNQAKHDVATSISKQTNLTETYGATGPYSTRTGGEVETVQTDSCVESFKPVSGPLSEDYETLMANRGEVSPASDVFDEALSEVTDIENFLSRPIKISTGSWAVGTSFTSSLSPFSLFIANAVMRRKLANYKLVKFDLEIEVFIKGTKFHVGKMLVSHRYYGESNEYVTIGGDTQLITRSQRLSCDIDAGTGQGCKMIIPFVAPMNWINLGVGGPLVPTDDLSKFIIDSYFPLLAVSGGVDPVTITVFARAINLKLAAPTAYYAVSGVVKTLKPLKGGVKSSVKKTHKVLSRDEYDGKGPVSSVAAAVADAAGRLEGVPIIGPFMRATEIGANALGGIAALFGFSKPTVISNANIVRNTPANNISLMEGGDTVQKLTCTAKQEICVDPTTVGLTNVDELLLQTMCGNMTYITQFDWLPASAVGTLLGCVAVTPMIEYRNDASKRIIPTAVSYAARMFAAWSGTMEYEVEVVASSFHTGKIAIYYDPDGFVTSTDDVYASTFLIMLDLSTERKVRFSISWNQDVPYLDYAIADVRTLTTVSYSATPSSVNATSINGKWMIKVVNSLTVNDDVTPAKILVRVCGGQDLELVNPSGYGIQYMSPFLPVSGIFLPVSGNEDSDENQRCLEDCETIDLTHSKFVAQPKSLVFYGERIMSMRSLLKRYSYYLSLGNAGATAGKLTYILPQYPLTPGPDPQGNFTDSLAKPWTFGGYSFVNYIAKGFGMWRGSVRYKLLPCRGDSVSLYTVSRMTGLTARGLAITALATVSTAPVTQNATGYEAARFYSNFSTGSAVTPDTMKSLEFEVPYATCLRASKVTSSAFANGTNSLALGQPRGDAFTLNLTGGNLTAEMCNLYMAAGDDFTCFGFNGAPVMYYQVPVI